MVTNCRRCITLHIVFSHYFSLHSDQNYASSCLVTYSLKYSSRYCTYYMTSQMKFNTSVFFSLFQKARPFTRLLLATTRFYDPLAFAIKIIKCINKNQWEINTLAYLPLFWDEESNCLRNIKGEGEYMKEFLCFRLQQYFQWLPIHLWFS